MKIKPTVVDGYVVSRESTLPERFVVWLRNLYHWRTAWAVKHLSKQLQRDPGFRESWRANIAMPIYDECGKKPNGSHKLMRHEFSHDCADKLMKHLFNA